MFAAINILVVILLVLANGFFVASEFALVGVRKSRIETLAASGNRRAKRLLGQVNNLNAYISATQLGITLASLALGWLGEPAIAHMLEGPLEGRVSETVMHTISFAIAFTIITFLHIVLGELAPKTLALERAEKTALAIALPLEIFYRVFSWPIRVLDWAGTRTVRLFGLHPSGEHGSIYTEEELRNLIDASHKSGHLEDAQQKLINSVFEFSDAEVREAMVPRTIVYALPVSASLEEVKKAFKELGYSRLPVYRDHMDNIAGVLNRRDLEPFLELPQAHEFNLEKILRAPIFVVATARLGAALKLMQSSRTHLAFVTDEYGGIEGIVTLEDLLEEIVGEIDDEYDEEVRSQIIERDGAYLLDGMLAVRDANRQLKINIPEDDAYTTVAGFMLARAGRLLRVGDLVDFDGAQFTVEKMDRRRIQRIRYVPAKEDSQAMASVIVPLICSTFLESVGMGAAIV